MSDKNLIHELRSLDIADFHWTELRRIGRAAAARIEMLESTDVELRDQLAGAIRHRDEAMALADFHKTQVDNLVKHRCSSDTQSGSEK